MNAPKHKHEAVRLEAIADLGLTDDAFERSYDEIVTLTRLATGMPICLFSVVDEYRQFFKAGIGLDVRETPREMAFCAWAINQENLDQAYVVEDAERNELFADNALVTGEPNIRFYAGIPIRAPNRLPVGTVCVIDRQARECTDDMQKALKSAQILLEDALLLHAQSVRDHLTQLYNRRYFDLALEREWRRSYRRLLPMSVLFVDVDHFKTYNDTYGHKAGDAALKRIAEALNGSTHRAGDILARYGGEEFVMVLPETDPEGAARFAEIARAAVEELKIPHSGSPFRHVTASVGAATALNQRQLGMEPEQIMIDADEALYEAKHQGRNRVVAVEMADASPGQGRSHELKRHND